MSKTVEAPETKPRPGDRNPDNPKQLWALCTSGSECPWFPDGRWVPADAPLKLAAADFKQRRLTRAQRERWRKPGARHGKLKTGDIDLFCGSIIRRAVRKPGKIDEAQLICGICRDDEEYVFLNSEEEMRGRMIFCGGCTPWARVAYLPEHDAGPTPERVALYAKIDRVRKALEGGDAPGGSGAPFWSLAKNYIEENPTASPKALTSLSLYVRHLTLYFERSEVGSIGPEQVDGFRDFMLRDGTRSEYTVGRMLEALRAMLTCAVSLGWLKANPLRGVTLARVRPDYHSYRIMTFGEEERLHAACVRELADLLPFLLYVADAPAYLSDYEKLTWGDVDFGSNLIPGRRGLLGMTPRLAAAMRALREASDGRPGAKIASRTRWQLDKAFRRVCAAAGVAGLRLDDIRRAGAWRLYESGMSVEHLAPRLGVGVPQAIRLLQVDRELAERERNSPSFIAFMREQLGVSLDGNGKGRKNGGKETCQRKPSVTVNGKTLDDLNASILKRYDEVRVNSLVTLEWVADDAGLGRLGRGDGGAKNVSRLLKRNMVLDTFPVYRDGLITERRSASNPVPQGGN